MGPLYLNTLYLHLGWVLSTEATMFFTVAQTGQTKHPVSVHDDWKLARVLHTEPLNNFKLIVTFHFKS